MKASNVFCCKYNKKRPCSREAESRCVNGAYCSYDPTRFDNRKITKGQILYLLAHGMKEEDIKDLSYLEAGSMIHGIKTKLGERIVGLY